MGLWNKIKKNTSMVTRIITNKSYMHLFSVGLHNFIINLVQNGSIIYVDYFVFDFI